MAYGLYGGPRRGRQPLPRPRPMPSKDSRGWPAAGALAAGARRGAAPGSRAGGPGGGRAAGVWSGARQWRQGGAPGGEGEGAPSAQRAAPGYGALEPKIRAPVGADLQTRVPPAPGGISRALAGGFPELL